MRFRRDNFLARLIESDAVETVYLLVFDSIRDTAWRHSVSSSIAYLPVAVSLLLANLASLGAVSVVTNYSWTGRVSQLTQPTGPKAVRHSYAKASINGQPFGQTELLCPPSNSRWTEWSDRSSQFCKLSPCVFAGAQVDPGQPSLPELKGSAKRRDREGRK